MLWRTAYLWDTLRLPGSHPGVLRHIVAPAARDGFDVDYCVLLIMQPSKMWSRGGGVGKSFTREGRSCCFQEDISHA